MVKAMLDNKKNSLAKLDNNVVEAIYKQRWTPEEHKLFLEVISRINKDDKDFKEIRIDIREFLVMTGDTYNTKNYHIVKDVAERLTQKAIGLEAKNGFVFWSVFSEIKHKKGEGHISIIINPRIKPFLLMLKENFTSIPKGEVYKLASSYAIKLYEMLKRFEDTGKRVDKIRDLRMKLGVEDKEYKKFSDFERWVLKKAVDDINQKTDLEVSYEKVKEGRRISHIVFYIKQKEGYTTENEKTPSENLDTQREKLSIPNPLEEKWKPIAKIRKEYQPILDELMPKLERLNENQVLFLLANLNTNLFPVDIAKEIIITADKNKSLNNPMGFLIKALQIDTSKTQYRELTLIPKKIDQELFTKKLEEKFVSFSKPKEMIMEYWNNHIVPMAREGKISKTEAKLLKEPITKMVYDDIENIIYVPAPDEAYKDWLEGNFLDDFKEFFRERFNVDDVIIELIDRK